MYRVGLVVMLGCGLSGCFSDRPAAVTTEPSASLVALGQSLFEEKQLSGTGGQSCASCHDAAHAFTDPDSSHPVSKGAVAGRSGRRNAPSVSYARYIPPLQSRLEDGGLLWAGGLFLDGRAESLEDQARHPFFEPNEMNLADAEDLRLHLRNSPTAVAFKAVYGENALDAGREEAVLTQVSEAIAAFERSTAVSPFSSKYDAYLNRRVNLSTLELEGLSLFVRADKGNCAACHVLDRGPGGEPPLFTDFTYDNIGVPHNSLIASTDTDGLFATAKTGANPALRGKFRVPGLRNVAKTAPYMHNGVFSDLRAVVEFYNTRDTDPARWAAIGAIEVPETLNRRELGHLGLNDHEVSAIVAFLNTLSDGYTP